MRPTAIGAPAPEPDDNKPTLEELIARTKAQLAAWHCGDPKDWGTMPGLMAQIAEARAERGPVMPAPDVPN